MSSRMRRGAILPLMCAFLGLTACNGWNVAGARVDPPAAVFAQPCPHPAYVALGAEARKDWEIMAGRLGDALLDCETRRAGLNQWADGVISASKPR